MKKDAQAIWFCREHNEVIVSKTVNGLVVGEECREGCINPTEQYQGAAWLYTWEELGLDRNPFPDDRRI